MSAVGGVSGDFSGNETGQTQITDLFAEAHQLTDTAKKAEKLDEAFRLIKADLGLHKELLFPLFEQYATEVCYGTPSPHDDYEGYKKAAALLEFTLTSFDDATIRQCRTITEVIDIVRAASLDRVYPPFKEGISAIKDKKLLAKMLIRLSFCHQNNPVISHNKEFRSFHQFLYDEVIKLLTELDDKVGIAEFRYNKDLYLFKLDHPDDLEGQRNTYNPVLALFREACGEESETYLGKAAQIKNMRAILLCRKGPIAGHIRTRALGLFREALAIRTTKLPNTSWNAQFLLANAQSSLASVLVEGEHSPEELEEAHQLIKAACAFAAASRAQGKDHNYFASYDKNRKKIDKLLGWGDWVSDRIWG